MQLRAFCAVAIVLVIAIAWPLGSIHAADSSPQVATSNQAIQVSGAVSVSPRLQARVPAEGVDPHPGVHRQPCWCL